MCDAGRRAGFEVVLRWSEVDAGCFDATFFRGPPDPAQRAGAGSRSAAEPAADSWKAYANDPSMGIRSRHLGQEMRAFLRERLPEAMIPSSFVAIPTRCPTGARRHARRSPCSAPRRPRSSDAASR